MTFATADLLRYIFEQVGVVNAMQRSHSDSVAQHSLHMDGMASDISIQGRSLEQIRKIALAMKDGGVGYDPSQFVHVDVGRIRTWEVTPVKRRFGSPRAPEWQ